MPIYEGLTLDSGPPQLKNHYKATELHFYWKNHDLNVNKNTISTAAL